MSSYCLLLFFFVSQPFPALAQTSLTVAAAADLTDLETPLATAFRSEHPKTSVIWVTEASGVLSQQIQNGAPYDVFLSANESFVGKLASSGKVVPSSVVVYATGRLGVLWKDGKSHPISDLTQKWVRYLALPNPKLAPYGAAAVQALQHAGLWSKLQNQIVYAENVRQTLQIFKSGNADAVITSASLLQGRHPDFIPDSWHQPIRQEAAVVASSAHRQAAREFLDFLKSASGQAVFARFGFGHP
ncbi:MAG TPA: molybdate ABC transporter substrate-binding protein [Bryobacteraceae bacterium]|nr:molybdate ABC transporter substrate-binding protein [Bryobacteraceae bacterium]